MFYGDLPMYLIIKIKRIQWKATSHLSVTYHTTDWDIKIYHRYSTIDKGVIWFTCIRYLRVLMIVTINYLHHPLSQQEVTQRNYPRLYVCKFLGCTDTNLYPYYNYNKLVIKYLWCTAPLWTTLMSYMYTQSCYLLEKFQLVWIKYQLLWKIYLC